MIREIFNHTELNVYFWSVHISKTDINNLFEVMEIANSYLSSKIDGNYQDATAFYLHNVKTQGTKVIYLLYGQDLW